MLEFFRKYQKYFFFVITIIIVISFSFFGTYSTLQDVNYRDQVAFTAVDGTNISRSELDDLAMFLTTDSEDKVAYGGLWGPNFLNDGVIKKDFLETGLAEVLVKNFPTEIQPDLETRFLKEKRYNLYAHPDANFISTESAWTYFAPDLKRNFDALRVAENPSDPAAFTARVRLYLGEKRFSPIALRQVIKYQEKQYDWLTPDPNLDRTDLALFGYHNVDDWFGPRFIRLISEFIINSAKIAEQKGYQVTKAEALADLVRNSDQSFQQNIRSPYLGVTNNQEYYNEQLRQMRLDQTKAVKIWQNVLLFRRLFHEAGNSVFSDKEIFNSFNTYAKESVDGEIYKLPNHLKLNDYSSLQKFEIYLNAVAKTDDKNVLNLPKAFLSLDEVSKKTPELVQKQYKLEIANINKKSLLTKVSVRDTWNWEVENSNWEQLKKEFPELGVKNGNTREERFAALDSLDSKTRSKVDAFARAAILETHPEWITNALQEAESETITVSLPLKGEDKLFPNLKDTAKLIVLLDRAPVATENEDSKVNSDELSSYTNDDNSFYKIRVLERKETPEIMTFEEANKKQVLDKLLDKTLQDYYQKNFVKNSTAKDTQLQNADGTWKSFETVKEKIADKYFEKVIAAIQTEQDKLNPSKAKEKLTGSSAAPLRFYGYMHEAKEKIQKDPKATVQYVKSEENLAEKNPLENQWKLEKSSFHIARSATSEMINPNEALVLKLNEWSKISTAPNGDIHFYQKKESKVSEDTAATDENVAKARKLLFNDVQSNLGSQLIAEMKDSNSISLDYLNATPEMTEE